MKLSLGIDTGGTFTDAVIYDRETETVLRKSKSPTTHENLTIGIGKALDGLDDPLLHQIDTAVLSTTLATNACVEGKGCRAKLIFIGIEEKILRMIHAEEKYGLSLPDVLCLDTANSFDGTVVGEVDWDAVTQEQAEWFASAEAFSVAAAQAMNNGAAAEKKAFSYLEAKYHVPVVMASSLTSRINVIERGATALLNARLLPVIREFTDSVKEAFAKRSISARILIVRSDGSLMTESFTVEKPVETILSGPAASVRGGAGERGEGWIVDMGGTTTDVSLLRDGAPLMSQGGIRIGSWRTQVSGVFTDTFALGGDSLVRPVEGQPALLPQRVIPLCAAASRWKKIGWDLRSLALSHRRTELPLHEALFLEKEPQHPYSPGEEELIGLLRSGPMLLADLKDQGVSTSLLLHSSAEQDGIIMRCGLTPTDAMHLTGDYSAYDTAAAVDAVRHVIFQLPLFREEEPVKFAEAVYDRVEEKLFTQLVRIMLNLTAGKAVPGETEGQLDLLLHHLWKTRNAPSPLFSLVPRVKVPLIGLGAPVALFLPPVAEVLGAECLLPENREVANAIGAVTADLRCEVSLRLSPAPEGFLAHLPDGAVPVDDYEKGVTLCKTASAEKAEEELRHRGAWGEITVSVTAEDEVALDKSGEGIYLGTKVTASARSLA